jgi:hypothetical protein
MVDTTEVVLEGFLLLKPLEATTWKF